MVDWWWDTQHQRPARVTIVLVIGVYDKIHWTNLSGNQHAWLLYLTISNIWYDIHCKPNQHTWMDIGLMEWLPKCAQKTDEAWHSAAGIVLSLLSNIHITGPSLKWHCAHGFQRQCSHLLAAWVGNYPDQVIVVQVSYGSCPMSDIPKAVRMRHSTSWPPDNPRDQHVYLELLDETNIEVLNTVGVNPTCNQFWRYPLCNVYRLW